MNDVIIVGAGSAGFSAALNLGRARRCVLLFDGGEPRNAPAAHSHGFLTRDGVPPLELLDAARAELVPYESVAILHENVVSIVRDGDGFRAETDNGETFGARSVILATGTRDELPAIPGLEEHWGGAVFHCPYCHGWEVRDQPLGVLASATAFERAVLLRGWTSDITVFANGEPITPEDRRKLAGLSIPIVDEPVLRLEDGATGPLRVVTDGNQSFELTALMVGPRQFQRSPLAATLGCEVEWSGPGGMIEAVKIDPMGETTVPGVYAAGDMAAGQSIALSVGSGARAAYSINQKLALADAERALLTATVG